MMDVFEGKNKRYRKQLTKFGEAKFYEVSLARCLATPRVIVIPRAEVRVRAQASYGNITVLSHLNCFATRPLRCAVPLIATP